MNRHTVRKSVLPRAAMTGAERSAGQSRLDENPTTTATQHATRSRIAIMPLLASISALGIVRELLPNVALEALIPSALGDAARQGPAIAMSTVAVAAVLIVWAVAAVVLAGWRDVTRDA